MRSPLLPLLVFVALTAVPGCSGSGDCYECGWPVVRELEPNDLPAQANWLGMLYPGDALDIEGHVSAWGPDVIDGFALAAGTPMHVQFALWADDPNADLDVCLYDPDAGVYVACFETSAHPETGAFSILLAGKEVHLVVSPYMGASSYRLEVRVYEPCCYDGAPEALALEDGVACAHRPGSEERWSLYAPARELAEAETLLVAPGELIAVDLASGELQREPALLVDLGRR